MCSWVWTLLDIGSWNFLVIWAMLFVVLFLTTSFEGVLIYLQLFKIVTPFGAFILWLNTPINNVYLIKAWSSSFLGKYIHLHCWNPSWVYSMSRVMTTEVCCDFPVETWKKKKWMFRGAWWAAVCGVTQNRTWLKRLSGSRGSHTRNNWGEL